MRVWHRKMRHSEIPLPRKQCATLPARKWLVASLAFESMRAACVLVALLIVSLKASSDVVV